MTEAQLAVDNMIIEIDKLIGKYIYSYNDEELAEVVVRKLRENNYLYHLQNRVQEACSHLV